MRNVATLWCGETIVAARCGIRSMSTTTTRNKFCCTCCGAEGNSGAEETVATVVRPRDLTRKGEEGSRMMMMTRRPKTGTLQNTTMTRDVRDRCHVRRKGPAYVRSSHFTEFHMTASALQRIYTPSPKGTPPLARQWRRKRNEMR